MSETIFVAGATGGVGQQIVHKLIAANRPVHALVRDVQKASRMLDHQAELVEGDVTEPDGLVAALDGIRLVICTIGSRAVNGGNPQLIDYEGVCNLVQTAKAINVERFVLVSSIGVTQPDHPLNKFGQVMAWKLKGEDVLRESGLTYTVVRPGGLIDEPGGRNGIRFEQGDRITGRVTRADVAEVCIQSLAQPAARHVTFELINNDDAPPGDWAALFAALKTDK
jgi:uncharacterized protein YbjT (DUF2867 family)